MEVEVVELSQVTTEQLAPAQLVLAGWGSAWLGGITSEPARSSPNHTQAGRDFGIIPKWQIVVSTRQIPEILFQHIDINDLHSSFGHNTLHNIPPWLTSASLRRG